MKYLDGKNVLITGSCGTVGSGLVDAVLQNENLQRLICIDNNESELFFQEQKYLDEPRVHFQYVDIRDYERVKEICVDVDILFHVAALKHVIICERSPIDAVNTNILGLNNIIRAANENKISKVIFTSSDKAVNPTNVMGTSKLMGERIFTAANATQDMSGTKFVSTRFGNILGSTGSVIPIFKEQIKKGGPVTITEMDMTRFIMSIHQAVSLVINVADICHGGEVFITKMPAIKIIDLAEVMIQELAEIYGYNPGDIPVELIGCKPGEKIYEELMSEEEVRRSVELADYYSVLPAFRGVYHEIKYDYKEQIRENIEAPYTSKNEEKLSKDDIAKLLNENKLLTDDASIAFSKRYWPGDKLNS